MKSYITHRVIAVVWLASFFCVEGKCVAEEVKYGELYQLMSVSTYEIKGTVRSFTKVDIGSKFYERDKIYLACYKDRTFIDREPTVRDLQMVMVCHGNEWKPRFECPYFPIPTSRPSPPIRKPTVPAKKGCSYKNEDQSIFAFVNGSIFEDRIIPYGSKVEFGCKSIGQERLHGSRVVACERRKWRSHPLPTCRPPTNGADVIMKLFSSLGYELLPGDAAAVPLHSEVNVVCWTVNTQTIPRLYSNSAANSLAQSASRRGKPFVSIKIQAMTAENAGSYTCVSQNGGSHSIRLVVSNGNIPCQSLDNIPRVTVTYVPASATIYYGTEAHFSCLRSVWKLRGSINITCLDTGWSRDPPICTRICQKPPSIEHAYIVTEGEDITYVCRKGYKLIGKGSLSCRVQI